MLDKIMRTTILVCILLSTIFITQSICVGEDYIVEIDEETETQSVMKIIEEQVVEEAEVVEPDGYGTGEFLVPLDGTFTSGYGQRWGRLHGGIDIAAVTGTPIKAADSGKVVFTGDCGSYGLLVKIDHQNGYITYYAHCSKINVSVGDLVEKGEEISLVGNTGNSTGPHCHFEIRYNNERLDPLDFVKL